MTGIHSQRITTYFICFTLMLLVVQGCSRSNDIQAKNDKGKLQVVATLFPIYDFTRTIVGNRGGVSLLLPPGSDPHSFEPKPDDIMRIGRSSLFIYTNPSMEPWAARIIKGVDHKKFEVIESGTKVQYLKAANDGDGHVHNAHDGAEKIDPHIWLDFDNAAIMVDSILAGCVSADPANAGYYVKNATALKKALLDLDTRYREGLALCETRTLLHGGHFTFGYLAHRYGLSYRSLSGVSSESEPSAAAMANMVRLIRQSGAHYLFAEELLSPRITEILAAEAGVAILKLHGAHNLSREDFQRGATFIGLMDENLANLKKGLACRTK
ncbi:metal ABC transporter solute-binding protein, Zn/Mn family [Pelotalea chapellei]|uniref:Zinc ABC transporter substrate-binding protein n=1 Tax=Pelotalea chapellei TaxID=44671 RepID=A0ABS5U7X9_9BACT|nr:zinc ABC transporter substrate-binding protein [Pelotalea chapellei]MBT1071772.1 zinc ABC transporter substrate-binding protein [Pelotalea chapellei]